MGKLSSYLIVSAFLLLSSCDDLGFPKGLYGYQVIRLMTHDDSKAWTNTSFTDGACDQANLYLFEQLGDSIAFSELRYSCSSNSVSDTVFIMNGAPSSLGLYFTDSILWEDDSYWVVSSISESYLSINLPDDIDIILTYGDE